MLLVLLTTSLSRTNMAKDGLINLTKENTIMNDYSLYVTLCALQARLINTFGMDWNGPCFDLSQEQQQCWYEEGSFQFSCIDDCSGNESMIVYKTWENLLFKLEGMIEIEEDRRKMEQFYDEINKELEADQAIQS